MIYSNDNKRSIAPFTESVSKGLRSEFSFMDESIDSSVYSKSVESTANDDRYIMEFLKEAYGENIDDNSILITEKIDVKGELIDVGRILTDPVALLTGGLKYDIATYKYLKADIDIAKKDGVKYNPIDMKRTYKVIKSHNDRALKLAIDRTNDTTMLIYLKRIIRMVQRSCKKYQKVMSRYKEKGSAGIYTQVIKDMEKFGITSKDLEITVKNLDKLYQDTEDKIVSIRSSKKKKSVKENGYDEWLENQLENGEDNVASESPVGFVSQKSKPVKNQKAHLSYIKKKAHNNPTNGATGQKEMPDANSFNF